MVQSKKVEDLQNYGASLEMPKGAIKEQFKITLSVIYKKFGVLETFCILFDIYRNQRALKRKYPLVRKQATKLGEVIDRELFILSGLFLALAKRLGRAEAYEFLKFKVMYKLALTSMPLLYQVNELKSCEGDVFDNFKKMNIAMFKRTTEDGTWLMKDYQDEPNKLTIKVTTCTNVELFTKLNVPELGRFGCDHDVSGFAAIEKDVNCEFRRFSTIANGDDCCLFEFYRKGNAPDNAHLNI